MKQGEASDTRGESHLHGVFRSAVSPAGPGRVFVSRVLGIMDDEVCIGEKLGVMRVLAAERIGTPGGVDSGVRLNKRRLLRRPPADIRASEQGG